MLIIIFKITNEEKIQVLNYIWFPDNRTCGFKNSFLHEIENLPLHYFLPVGAVCLLFCRIKSLCLLLNGLLHKDQGELPLNLMKIMLYEPLHDKTNKMAYAPSEDSDQPGHPHSEDSDQTGRMPRLI